MTNSFDLTPVMIECRAYVDAIADFVLETPGQTEYTRDAIIQYESHERIKILLTEFLLECEQKFSNSQLDLMQLLRRNRNHYQVIQGDTIKKLNELIVRSEGEDLARFEDKRERFLNYFHHNYTLIDLISARLTNSPLSEHVQFNLKRVGLDWIVNSSQPLALLTQQLNEIDDRKTTKPRINQMSTLASCVSTFTDINFRISLLGSFGQNLCKERLNPIIIKQLRDFVKADELNDLLADFFTSRNETALQNTYSKVLIENLLNDWLPVLKTITGMILSIQEATFTEIKVSETGETIFVERDLQPEDYSAVKDNTQELHDLYYTLARYNQRIIDQIRQFTPNLYQQHIDAFQEYVNMERILPRRPTNQDTQLTEQSEQPDEQPAQPGDKLSAPQKLLFIRLLQQTGLFPQKPKGTDDAPELRAIAMLTGLDFGNDIKGGTGANFKVNQLLNNRQSLTTAQIPYKLADLDKVAGAARLLNVEPVLSAIDVIRADLEKLRQS